MRTHMQSLLACAELPSILCPRLPCVSHAPNNNNAFSFCP